MPDEPIEIIENNEPGGSVRAKLNQLISERNAGGSGGVTNHNDLAGIGPDDHHNRAHSIFSSLDHPDVNVGSPQEGDVLGWDGAQLTTSRRMRWRFPYSPGTEYKAMDVVRDGIWTMVANKDTTDIAAPQPIGPETYLLDIGDPDWSEVSDPGTFVATGNQFTLSLEAYYQGFRVYLPAVGPDIFYSVILRTDINGDITDEFIEEFQGISSGWLEIPRAQTLLATGSTITVILVYEDRSQRSTETASYNYSSSDSGSVPGPGEASRSFTSGWVRFNNTPSSGSINTSNIQPGTVITADGIQWTVNAVTASSGYVECLVTGTGNAASGVIDFTFSNPSSDVDQRFWENTNYWNNNNPPNGSAQGYLNFDGSVALNNNGYGADILIQEADISDDWDVLATSASVVGGGGGGGDGEYNQGRNLSPGEGIYAQKVDEFLEFKGIVGGDDISVTSDGTSLTIDYTGSGGGPGEVYYQTMLDDGAQVPQQRENLNFINNEFELLDDTLNSATSVQLAPLIRSRIDQAAGYLNKDPDLPILIMCEGQSNLQGGTDPNTFAWPAANPEVWEYRDQTNYTGPAGGNRQWVPYDPSGATFDNAPVAVRILGSRRGSLGDPVYPFADAIQRYTGRRVYIVCIGYPGSALMPLWDLPSGGGYTFMEACWSEAIGHLQSGTNGAPEAYPNLPEYADIWFWSHGESDAAFSAESTNGYENIPPGRPSWEFYSDNFIALFDQRVSDGHLDKTRTKMLYMPPGVDSTDTGGTAKWFEEWRGIDYVISRTQDTFDVLDSRGAEMYDSAHYTVAGYFAMAERMSEKWIAGLQTQRTTDALRFISEDVTPRLAADLNGDANEVFDVAKFSAIQRADAWPAQPEPTFVSDGTRSIDYASGLAGAHYSVDSEHLFYESGGAFGGGDAFSAKLTVRNLPQQNMTLPGAAGYNSNNLVVSDGANIQTSGLAWIDMSSLQESKTESGGDLLVSRVSNARLYYYHDGNVTTNQRAALDIWGAIPRPGSAGTVSRQVGIVVNRFDPNRADNNTYIQLGNQILNDAFPLPSPDGNWAIYQSDNYPSRFNGGIQTRVSEQSSSFSFDDSLYHVIALTTGVLISGALPDPDSCVGRRYRITNDGGFTAQFSTPTPDTLIVGPASPAGLSTYAVGINKSIEVQAISSTVWRVISET